MQHEVKVNQREGRHHPFLNLRLLVGSQENKERLKMKTYLQIKVASLAAEARIIRKHERAALRSARWEKQKDETGLGSETQRAYTIYENLYSHRVRDVRYEARAAQLALGYLRGQDYASMEQKAYKAPAWSRVAYLVKKYNTGMRKSPDDVLAELKNWGAGSASPHKNKAAAMAV